MATQHNPLKQTNLLHQCLLQDKRPIGFFLSAGCPVSVRVDDDGTNKPLIPDVKGLSDEITVALQDSDYAAQFAQLLANLEADGKPVDNVELWLTFIRALKPIVGTGTVRDHTAVDLKNLEREICVRITNRVNRDLPVEESGFSRLAAWIGSTNRSEPTEIFTTNYDLLIEQGLERKRIPYFDGFVGTSRAFFDAFSIENDLLPSRWSRLWKLHGSINWSIGTDRTVTRGAVATESHLIHPSHLKFDESRKMPFLAMTDRLRGFLSKPSATLVTCGYSFRDEHLNECMIEALSGNPRAVVFGLVYGTLAEHSEAAALARSTTNLNLLAKDGAVIGGQQGTWSTPDGLGGGILQFAVRHVPAAGATDDLTEFLLGDFAKLGAFLATMTGTTLLGEVNEA
jgi:hypothetical protein